ncbi:phage holin family protein [Companilactobacillus halodurans]|uniref:Phage holin family protein n=1 Tax=Companilactobacillus halodurans TaxID=2584183 RepID=A0A5P0ZUG9_9LACO|nr:phage holin family protein [Companilactobacillus halodurans]MQS75831.1 phage holin family protein [Companilactobacillus halodurans]MQS96677.1 phage holin family protein [Companilactobacillus halodurans]
MKLIIRVIIRVVVQTLLFLAIARLLPGMFQIASLGTAIIASVVLAILNMIVRPFLHIISLPITFITFGLFSFVINAFTLELTSSLVGPASFHFSSFGSAIVVAIILAICNSIINSYTMDKFQRRV